MAYNREKIIEERGRKCEKCGWGLVPEVLEIHHKLPRQFGGTDSPDNLIVLCPNCHAITHLVLRKQGKARTIRGELR